MGCILTPGVIPRQLLDGGRLRANCRTDKVCDPIIKQIHERCFVVWKPSVNVSQGRYGASAVQLLHSLVGAREKRIANCDHAVTPTTPNLLMATHSGVMFKKPSRSRMPRHLQPTLNHLSTATPTWIL
jgi:hypothetical protein